jgi:hypothetical protein
MSDFTKHFMVDCDASSVGFGVVLHQGDGAIAFFSRHHVTRNCRHMSGNSLMDVRKDAISLGTCIHSDD